MLAVGRFVRVGVLAASRFPRRWQQEVRGSGRWANGVLGPLRAGRGPGSYRRPGARHMRAVRHTSDGQRRVIACICGVAMHVRYSTECPRAHGGACAAGPAGHPRSTSRQRGQISKGDSVHRACLEAACVHTQPHTACASRPLPTNRRALCRWRCYHTCGRWRYRSGV